MKQRNPLAVFLFGLITLGLYSWYWAVVTKGEMNTKGEHIPTAWIWLIPVLGWLYWLWKYSEGVEHVTSGKTGAAVSFLLLWLLGSIGQAIVQASFNDHVAASAPAATPPAAPGPTAPVEPASPAPQPPTPPVVQ